MGQDIGLVKRTLGKKKLYDPFKRLFDITVTLFGILLVSPLLILVSVLIILDSPGPIFFKQKRIGEKGQAFYMYKFRTMVVNAEELLKELKAKNEAQGNMFKMKNDPRVTRVGRFLRKSSIDELPQLLNVLIGNMSLVGPRPPLPREVEQYSQWDMLRLEGKPGITGLWQVSGRSEIGFDDMVMLDLKYLENRSFWLDIKLLALTIPAVLKGEGAY